ncbi:MAG: hypothetical protein HZY79_15560 [Rhodoblastus sp.]|nr:MAG: hypothetical protein HZY79_15560 [Rhodoblastus sp.]
MAEDKMIETSAAKAAEATAAKDDGRADYVVTERAGPRVAGRLVKPGDRLRLTAAEADYHLAAGEIIVAKSAAPSDAPAADAAKAKRGA